MIDQLAIEDEVAAQIEALDPMGRLRGGNFKEALERCAYKVYGVMEEEGRAEIDEAMSERLFVYALMWTVGGTLETARVAAIANPYLRANSTNRYANVAAKLRVWQQRRYGVAVYIDADFLVLRSLDFLFEAASNASLVGCPDARGRKAAKK